jgi:hypothetical protein
MRPMHFTRFVGLTGVLAGCALLLAAAPGRPQDAPLMPAMPVMPVMPVMPSMPAMRSMPALPAMPEMPAMPALPAMPEMASPEMPSMPPMPAMSAMPAIAALPAESPEPAFGSHRSDDATSCEDMHIMFDSERPIMDSEEHTLTKAEASTLHIDNLINAGVQARGWDKDTYSVTACKFADRRDRDAKELLSQIKMSISGGHVSVSGPERTHEHWAVQLLVRTPRGANLEIKTQNGPASFSEVDGKIYVRAENGPVSMSNCTGEADVRTQNGPISISGKSGKLKLHTENGPISVALQSPNWTDGGLVADAVNGPVSLSVPSELNTSFLLESTGHSPITCNASVCKSARKTFDDNDNRRIEYGNGDPVIRLSTVNGPVTVSAL